MNITLLYKKLAGPAQRALQTLGITEVEELSRYTRQTLLDLHGIGPGALSVIDAEMDLLGVSFLGSGEDPGAALVDEYIRDFPEQTRAKLNEMREIISSEAPDATEKISYQMPTFYLHGNLVHYAGFKNHIGFYPIPSGIAAFQDDLKGYKQGKGSVQFPINEPLPVELIKKVVRFRVEENTRKALEARKKKRSGA